MESIPLIITDQNGKTPKRPTRGLSVWFATLCIIDLFGVFPIIALPRPIIDCGWLGLPLAVGVFAMQIYTALLLGRSWVLAENLDPTIVEKSRYPYAALANLTMGSRMSKLVTFLLDVTIFGAGVPNLLVASQNMQLLGSKISHSSFEFSFCYWMVLFGLALCPVMWLGSPKDMKWLAVASVSTVCCVGSLTWICMLTDDSLPDGFQPRTTPPSWEAVAIAYGILAFQVLTPNMTSAFCMVTHGLFAILGITVTVATKRRGEGNGGLRRRPKGLRVVAIFSEEVLREVDVRLIGPDNLIVTGGLFTVTTTIGFWKYGSAGLRYNLLQGLPASVSLYTDVLLVTMQIALSMVVGASALFQDIEDKLGVPKEFNWRRCLLRSSVMFLSVLVGESVPRFDLVMGLIGGSLTGPLMFILPPLFYRRLRERTYQRQQSTWEERSGELVVRVPRLLRRWADVLSFDVPGDSGPPSCWDGFLTTAIVILGVTATIASTYFSMRDTFRYATFTPPCLVNVTLASRLLFTAQESLLPE